MAYRVTVTTPTTGAVLSTWTFEARKPKQFIDALADAGAPPKTLDYVRRHGVPRRTNWETHTRKIVVTADKEI